MDIKIGAASVKDQFQLTREADPSLWDVASLRRHFLQLHPKNEKAISVLRNMLVRSAERAIVVQLGDEADYAFRGITNHERLYPSLSFSLASQLTPCDEITRISYQEIDDRLRRDWRQTGGTAETIQLVELFELLLRDKIKPFLASLSPIDQRDSCFLDFELLRWLKGSEATGFVREEYRLHQGLLDLLNVVAQSIASLRAEWQEIDIVIRTVGYADSVGVEGIRLEQRATGIEDWDESRPFHVSVVGCEGDRLTNGTPVFVELDSKKRSKIQFIRDNCDLGAVRAYVAARHLESRLGRDRTRFEYATAGVRTRDIDDSKNRRVEINIEIKASRESRE